MLASAPQIPTPHEVDWLERLALPVWLFDADNALVYLNQAASQWLHRSPRRLLGQRPAQWLDMTSAALLSDATRHAREEDRRVVLPRARITLSEGAEHFADITLTAVSDTDRLIGHVLVEATPTAEFAGDDPAQLLPAALHASLRGLAHEVRNPLAGLRGAAQLLERRVEDVEARRYLDVIRAETDRLHALVERLLTPSPPQPLVEVVLHEVIERVRFLIEVEAGWAVRIVRDYDPSVPNIAGDADRLIQAVLNLARNALEAGASEVRLRTRVEHGIRIGDIAHRQAVRLDVIDNGRGVSDALTERVFLPLVSGRSEGTGLGLTLSQEIAREHAGSLSFRSRPGHTVFTLLLPIPAPSMPPSQASHE